MFRYCMGVSFAAVFASTSVLAQQTTFDNESIEIDVDMDATDFSDDTQFAMLYCAAYSNLGGGRTIVGEGGRIWHFYDDPSKRALQDGNVVDAKGGVFELPWVNAGGAPAVWDIERGSGLTGQELIKIWQRSGYNIDLWTSVDCRFELSADPIRGDDRNEYSTATPIKCSPDTPFTHLCSNPDHKGSYTIFIDRDGFESKN